MVFNVKSHEIHINPLNQWEFLYIGDYIYPRNPYTRTRIQWTVPRGWEFQDPKMEVPSIYVWPKFQGVQGIYTPNKKGQTYGTNVPPFCWILEFPLIFYGISCGL